MRYNLKTIKEAYDQVALHKNDLRLSNLADEIEGFERELREILEKACVLNDSYACEWIQEVLGE